MRPFEEVTVTLQDGTSAYWPPGDFTRLVPSLACGVASRIVRLRKALKELAKTRPEDHAKFSAFLAPYLAELPFERQLLSGKIEKVHDALKPPAPEFIHE